MTSWYTVGDSANCYLDDCKFTTHMAGCPYDTTVVPAVPDVDAAATYTPATSPSVTVGGATPW